MTTTTTHKSAGKKTVNGTENRGATNFNIFNGGKIRIDLTNTKYRLLKECALEMKWKVIIAKKPNENE